ncbi:MAG: hypothetical protein VKQ33_12550 [Candidatus Sericytochromatia bacterium]|nr:hypothetical protein [Candidatus Sericytochromatia bacterium]
MPAPPVRPLCLSFGLALLLAGCSVGRPSALPAAAPRGGALTALATPSEPLAGPLTACRVLAVTHVLARRVDPRAAFLTLVGHHIGSDGQPMDGGTWQAHYVGTAPTHAAEPGTPRPAVPLFRHVTITAGASGQVTLEVAEHPGLPLGPALFDDPMPRIDSHAAIAHARTMRPTHPLEGGLQLTLGGSMSPAHFQELVWKVQASVQAGPGRPVVFNASTGLPVER